MRCGKQQADDAAFCGFCGARMHTAAVGTAEQPETYPTCDICGRQEHPWRVFPHYGGAACDSCHYSIINRRALAGLIDIGLTCFAAFGVGFLLGLFAGLNPNSSDRAVQSVEAGAFLIGVAMYACYWLSKDSWFGGRSVGKLVCGLRVVDKATGLPISVAQCVQRNLPLLIPFAPLIAAIQLNGGDGSRMGDGWANAKVIRA
jgi:uncharacterized RDD family membrane protein YckC